jgi:hypothetical protein
VAREARNVVARQLSELIEQHGLQVGILTFSSHNSPIPILQASFCGISLHIGRPTFFRRIVGKLS